MNTPDSIAYADQIVGVVPAMEKTKDYKHTTTSEVMTQVNFTSDVLEYAYTRAFSLCSPRLLHVCFLLLCIIDVQMVPSGHIGLYRPGSSHMDDPYIRYVSSHSAHSIMMTQDIRQNGSEREEENNEKRMRLLNLESIERRFLLQSILYIPCPLFLISGSRSFFVFQCP